jgi:hypothetical protein
MSETLASGLTLTIPTVGETNWDLAIKTLCFQKISEHDHTGGGKGIQIGTNALVTGAVTTGKIATGAVNSTVLADNAVTSAKILAGSITGPKLFAGGVDAATTRIFGGTSTGSANAQVIAPSPAISTLQAGEVFTFIPGFSNTGAATLQIGSATARSLRYMGQALVGGEIVANNPCTCLVDASLIHILNHGGGWATWTPSYSAAGSMTYTSVTTNVAQYQRHGNQVNFMVNSTGTTGGTASNEIIISIPVSLAGGTSVMPAYLVIGGSILSGLSYHATATTIAIRRYDNTNYSLGPNLTASVTGSYRA